MSIVTCVGDHELTLLKAVLEDDEELTAEERVNRLYQQVEKIDVEFTPICAKDCNVRMRIMKDGSGFIASGIRRFAAKYDTLLPRWLSAWLLRKLVDELPTPPINFGVLFQPILLRPHKEGPFYECFARLDFDFMNEIHQLFNAEQRRQNVPDNHEWLNDAVCELTGYLTMKCCAARIFGMINSLRFMYIHIAGMKKVNAELLEKAIGGTGVWRVPPLLDEQLLSKVNGDLSRERKIQRKRRLTRPERLAKSATDGSLGGDLVALAAVVARVIS